MHSFAILTWKVGANAVPLGQDKTAAGVASVVADVEVDGIAIVRRGAEAANWLPAAVVLTANVTGCCGSVTVATGRADVASASAGAVAGAGGAVVTGKGWMGSVIVVPSSNCWSWTGGDSEETVDDDEPSDVFRADLAGMGSSPSCVAMIMQDLLTHAFFNLPGPPYLF